MGKKAVVFVIDASLPAEKLESTKRSVKEQLTHLMLQQSATTLLVGVNVVPTIHTDHHKQLEMQFENVTELVKGGIGRPSTRLLHQLESIKGATPQKASVLDAMFLAVDAMREHTYGKSKKPLAYERSIVLFTNALVSPVTGLSLSMLNLLVVIDAMREMKCRLQVVGIDFGSSATYDEPLPAEMSQQAIRSNADVQGDMHDNIRADDVPSHEEHNDGYDDNDGDNVVYYDKDDVEDLLKSITEKTGGEVLAVSTLQQIIDQSRGRKLLTSIKRKMDFKITPNLTIPCRYMLLMRKESTTRLKAGFIVSPTKNDSDTIEASQDDPLDHSNELRNKIEVEPVKNEVIFYDEDKPDEMIDASETVKAIKFGSTLIPMALHDFSGVILNKACEHPFLEVLAYTSKSKIPHAYLIGPPYGIVGDPNSQRAITAIAAIAQALVKLDRVAICNFCKSKQGQPVLSVLYPFPADDIFHGYDEATKATRLVLLQLPYRDDVKKFDIDDSWPNGFDDKSKAADDMINALRLPSNVLNSGHVPNPFARSWNQTVIARAMDPSAEVVKSRHVDKEDLMKTPQELLDNARTALTNFHDKFPISVSEQSKKKDGRKSSGRNILTYKDLLKNGSSQNR